MADEIAASDKWVDTKTGKVVSSQPEEGILLVAKGSPLTADRKAAVDAAELAASGKPSEVKTVTTGVETATAPESTRKSSK